MRILFLTLSMLSINLCFSQTKVSSVNVDTEIDTVKVSTNLNQPVTISMRKGESQVVHDRNYYLSEIERIDNHIKSIDDKVKWVKENEIISSVWFMDMDKIKSNLLNEKSEILKKLN